MYVFLVVAKFAKQISMHSFLVSTYIDSPLEMHFTVAASFQIKLAILKLYQIVTIYTMYKTHIKFTNVAVIILPSRFV